jgi:arylsulfatase
MKRESPLKRSYAFVVFLNLLLHCKSFYGQRLPNFVIIFTDDMGYADISPYGGKTRTPNLARMAKEGIRFTDFYVANPSARHRGGAVDGLLS